MIKLNFLVIFMLLFSFSAVTEEGIKMPEDKELADYLEASPKYQKEYLRINKLYLKERLHGQKLSKEITRLKDELAIVKEDFTNAEKEIKEMDQQLTKSDDRYEKLYKEFTEEAGREPADDSLAP